MLGFGESQHPAYQTLTKNDTDIILPDRLNTLSASAQFSCSVELTDITPLSSGPDADELGVLRQDNRLPSLLGDVHQPSGPVRARLEIPTVTESSYSSTIDQLGPEPTFPASQPTRPRLVSPTLTTWLSSTRLPEPIGPSGIIPNLCQEPPVLHSQIYRA